MLTQRDTMQPLKRWHRNIYWHEKIFTLRYARKLVKRTVCTLDTKWNKPVIEECIPHDSTYIKYFKVAELIEAETRMVVAKGWGGGQSGQLLSNKFIVQDELSARGLLYKIAPILNTHCTLKFFVDLRLNGFTTITTIM